MNLFEWVLDGLLGAALLWLAVRALFSRELLGSVLNFIAIGIVMALAWIRLGAQDIALAEAALGGGITGALLLATLNRLSTRGHVSGDETRDTES